jgi:hypothetical protein
MGMTDFVAAIKQRRNERAAVVPSGQEAAACTISVAGDTMYWGDVM